MTEGAPTSYTELVDVLILLPTLVREKRRRDSLSLRSAARNIGIPPSNLTRFEKGEDVYLIGTALPILRWVAT